MFVTVSLLFNNSANVRDYDTRRIGRGDTRPLDRGDNFRSFLQPDFTFLPALFLPCSVRLCRLAFVAGVLDSTPSAIYKYTFQGAGGLFKALYLEIYYTKHGAHRFLVRSPLSEMSDLV